MSSPGPVAAHPGVILGIEDLPVELLDTIFGELSRSNSASLANCVLVCRAWSQIAYPRRFSNVACTLVSHPIPTNFPTHDAFCKHRCAIPKETTEAQLVSFIRSPPRFAEHVKSFFICSSNMWLSLRALDITIVRDIVACFPSLRSLELAGFTLFYDISPPSSWSTNYTSLVRKPLQHLSIRRVDYLSSSCIGFLLSLFHSIDRFEAIASCCTAPLDLLYRELIPSTPVKSLVVSSVDGDDDADVPILPIDLGLYFQTSTLQYLDITADYIIQPHLLSEFVKEFGIGLQSVRLRYLTPEENCFIDLSPCANLLGLDIFAYLPCLEPPALLAFPSFLSCTWQSILQTIHGTTSALRTLSVGLQLNDCVLLWDDMPGGFAGNHSSDVMTRLRQIDWNRLERSIEEHPMLQAVHIQIDATEFKDSPVLTTLKANAEEVIRMELSKSQHIHRILQVSVITTES